MFHFLNLCKPCAAHATKFPLCRITTPQMTCKTSRSIYVQIDIHGPIERVWELTQTPHLHQQWDLRFTEITYLSCPEPGKPQRFLYATRIGFGLAIRGEGETVGIRNDVGGRRSSALKFRSDDPKSLIRAGSGYWKYVPLPDGGMRFLTGYDYDVRFGILGRLVDRFAFRPLMGWATAWSFDRLRLWVESGVPPAITMRRTLTHASARVALAVVWLYQGIVPKLLFPSLDELAMLRAAGFSDAAARAVRTGMGWAEIALGLTLLLAWRSRWPVWLTLVLMPLAAIGVAITSPRFLAMAFNPIALNASVFALAVIALLESVDLPAARRCVRRMPQEAA